MEVDRSLEQITKDDLKDLYVGSVKRLREYFIHGEGAKWENFYNIEQPLVAALCQGAAMHYSDKITGVKDFDVWFFYPFNKKHLPYRTIWNWDYKNPKFGRNLSELSFEGRRVDVLVRSIKNYALNDPVRTIHIYLDRENTTSSRELARKAVVLLYPESLLGKIVWYKQKI